MVSDEHTGVGGNGGPNQSSIQQQQLRLNKAYS